MAIKVKHEGNATPGAFASESGGEAKRRQQDAAMLASVMQQAANAGNQQLRGASAPGASPGRSSAQLVHAPLMGAPSAPLLPRGGGASPVRTAQSATKEPPRFRYSQRSETPQEQAAKRAASVLGREDEVVESNERFGQHSPDATWDPTNGGRWVRKRRPGENEAAAFEERLTSQQRAELAGINNALEEARRSGRYTEAEMAELERQADARRLGIKPLPQPKQTTAQEAFDDRLVTFNGIRGYLDGSGKFVELPGSQKSASDVYGGTHVDEQGRRWGIDGSGKLYQVGADQVDDFASIIRLVPETKLVQNKNPVTGANIAEEVPLTAEEKQKKLEEIMKLKAVYSNPPQQVPPPSAIGANPLAKYEQYRRK